ncbi:type II secretion system secretin GspD [Paenalcaligenes niemegkensis]|uniref:type II secretion system secretin GspD n=1 Tax=Paenalcaligenes niemegkensis TaxID=2895469 RepID=UPI001EE9AE1C|nr:type II secretion system secretin GspD [Paenalcaligenes niemegkensis]MCQ9617059.1 type II secretion system secretin GspD [Paenalcaligenes niemegkensis]
MRTSPYAASPRLMRPVTVVLCFILTGCVAPAINEKPFLREGMYVPSSTSQNNGSDAMTAPVAEPAADTTRHVIRSTSNRGANRHAAAAQAPSNNDEPGVSLNFVDADLQVVLRALARFTGRNFLVDPRVTGNLTLVSDGEVSERTAYNMLLGALRMQGFTIVDVDGVSRVVPAADAKAQGGAVNPSVDEVGGIATRTFRLSYESAEKLVPVLQPMIAGEGSLTAYPGNNTLVITDHTDNLNRIARIIQSIDTPTSLDTDVIKIHNGVAVDIAAMASDLLEGGGQGTDTLAVMADPRSNSVVIRSSSPERTELARNLIIELDNVQTDPGNMHVVYLRNAQATHLATVLRGALTGESPTSALTGGDSVRAALGSGGMLGGAGAEASGSSANGGGLGSSSLANSGTSAIDGDQSSAFSAGGVTVQADVSTNTLIISAPEPIYRSLRKVIDLLDQRRAQVLVESMIVEVTETDASELGVQWMTGNGRLFGGAGFGGSGLNANASTTLDVLPSGLNIGVIDGSVNLPGVGEILNLKVLARALETKGGANILSTPNLLTLDNEQASIMVGKTVPFISGQYVTDGGGGSSNPFQTIQREDVGLKLNIRPQISEGGTVKLDIYQEVSSLDNTASGSMGGVVTNKRALDTSVLLDDGQIMVLGGLLEDTVQSSTEAVPVLGSIPILGALFRYESRQRVKTNLMIFLRPYVVRNVNDGYGLTVDRYNFMRRAQSRAQPAKHPLLRDISTPILPPIDLPLARARSRPYDLRPENWDQTQGQRPPLTHSSTELRQLPRPAGDTDSEPVVRTRLPTGVNLASHPEAFHGQVNRPVSVVQFAEVAELQDATRIAQRVRISGLDAYAVSGPGGASYVVRVDVARDPTILDNATQLIRELGYQPELVVTP